MTYFVGRGGGGAGLDGQGLPEIYESMSGSYYQIVDIVISTILVQYQINIHCTMHRYHFYDNIVDTALSTMLERY